MSGLEERHDEEGSQFFLRDTEPDVNGRILLLAIISLSIVVVVVATLHIYARCMLRRQARRRAALQELGIIVRIQSNEPPKRGLDPTVIASLPVLIYKHVDGTDQTEWSPECTVCLSVFDDGQMVRVLPNCKHRFHVECIDKWLGSQSTCPVCRHEVEPGPTMPPLPHEPTVGRRLGPPSAPPLEGANSTTVAMEGTSDRTVQLSAKVDGTSSRLSSFRRMLSRDRSSRRIHSCTQEDGIEDLERQ